MLGESRGWIIGLLLIFLIAIFHIHSIHTTYMRDDEEIALRITSRTLDNVIRYQADSDVHAPLWFMTLNLWQQVMGDSEFMGRIYSIFLSMMTLALVYRMGRYWFKDARFGWFGLIALGVNAYFFIYALEIRPYAMIMLVAAFSMWAFRRWLICQTRSAALLYGLTLVLMLYIHYFMVFLVAAQLLYFIFMRPDGKLIRQSIGAGLLAFIFWLPWLPIFINQVGKLISIEAAGGQSRGIAGIGTTTQSTTPETIFKLLELMTNGQLGLYALVLCLGVIIFWRKSEFRLILLWGIGVPTIALLANFVVAVYTPRYVSYLIIGFGLLIGVALAGLPKYWRWGGIFGFAVISLWALPSQLPTDRIPFRDLLLEVARNAQPGDVIYFDHADLMNNVLRWQIRHYLPRDLWNNRTEDVEIAAVADRVWFVTGDWFNPDVQANFERIEDTHPLQHVIGKCDRYWCYLIQLLESPNKSNP